MQWGADLQQDDIPKQMLSANKVLIKINLHSKIYTTQPVDLFLGYWVPYTRTCSRNGVNLRTRYLKTRDSDLTADAVERATGVSLWKNKRRIKTADAVTEKGPSVCLHHLPIRVHLATGINFTAQSSVTASAVLILFRFSTGSRAAYTLSRLSRLKFKGLLHLQFAEIKQPVKQCKDALQQCNPVITHLRIVSQNFNLLK